MTLETLLAEPLARFIAQLASVVLVSRLLGVLARRAGQPLVIAEIVAGIMLGPSLLGWVAPEAAQALFPSSSLPSLQLVSQLGLMLFMFLIGLELDPALLKGRGHTSVAISHASIIVPFAGGALLGLSLFPEYAEPGARSLPFTLFLGAAMSITAFPVLARILGEHQLLRTRIGAVAIACAAVDDVTAWCLLAFVVAATRATGLSGAVMTTLLAVAYVLVMLLLVRPLLARIGRRATNPEGLTQGLVAVVLLMLFLSSWTTELIGIHALFGAFLFGVTLPREGGFARALAEKLEDIVIVALLPLFFAYSGVRTHIGLLSTADDWATCALILLVACAGKFGGGAVAARLTGLSWRESSALGVLMNTRGLMELIVLNIGLDLGVIGPKLFTMMVLMALITTFMTTPVLHVIYPRKQLTRELVAAADGTRIPPVTRPYTVLLCVAYDQSGPGLVTLAHALRGRERPASVLGLSLVPASNRTSLYVGDDEASGPPPNLGPAIGRARELGLELQSLSFVSSSPAADIVSVAQVKSADLVLLGWHKPLLSGTLLGGTVAAVMRDAPADVGVLIDRGLDHIERVLVPFIGSVHDRAALALARRLLESTAAEVTLLHVPKPVRRLDEAALGAQQAAEDVFQESDGARVIVRVREHASPTDAVLEESQRGYDLVIVGGGREWGLEDRRYRVQPERLMTELAISTLVVRRGTHRGAAADPAALAATAPAARPA